jgi:hypothetical protein
MPHIVMTEEQMKALEGAEGYVDVRDPHGRPLASMRLLTPMDLEAIERHRRNRDRKVPGILSERVKALLRKMHELDDAGQLDQAKVEELLARTQAGEPL